jgi:putative membrane-bound dehydrogenase-like protein
MSTGFEFLANFRMAPSRIVRSFRLTAASLAATAAIQFPLALFAESPRDEFPPPLSPEEGLASLSVPEGLRVELVAAEPLVFDPVAFDWGTDAELWVVEMADYPSGDGGRVVRLTDENDDGRYDRRQVFLDDLPLANGVMAWRDGVLVSASPEILYAEDTNDDGRCDVRQTLFRGFSRSNPQHLMNGFAWGLDGWVHAGGEEGRIEIFAGEAAESITIRGDFRFDPEHLLIEQESGRTQFGRARNDFDDWFGTTNSDPGFQVTLPERYLVRNPHLAAPSPQRPISETPGAARVYPTSPTLERFNDLNKADRFTSACGLSIYRDDLLGEAYRGNSFVAEPVHNLVHREIVSPDGTRWISRRAESEASSEFFRSSDPWSRPAMTRTGPDGAIWIADMYRAVIEHPEWIPDDREAQLDLRAGSDRGRIYRVVPADRPLRPIPRTKEMSVEELVRAIDSPNGPSRDMAHLALAWRGDKRAAEGLVRLAHDAALPAVRVQALGVLSSLDSLDDKTIETAMQDGDAEVRRFAARLAESRLYDSAELRAALTRLADDPSARVRMQVAFSLGTMPAGTSGEPLARIAVRDGADPDLRAAIFSSATTDLSGFVKELAAQIVEAPPEVSIEALALATAVSDDEATSDLLGAILAPTEDVSRRMRQVETLVELDVALRRRSSSLVQFRKSANDGLRKALAGVDDVAAFARSRIEDREAPLSERTLSVRLAATLGTPEDVERLERLLEADVPPEVQSAAIDGLCLASPGKAPELILANWNNLAPASRATALDRLTSVKGWKVNLVEAIASGKLPASSFDVARRQSLLTDDDEEIRTLAASALGGPSDAERGHVVDRYRAALELTADAARGAGLFDRQCAACHRLRERGHEVGPDLAALSDRSPEAMLIAILDPNRAVETKFVGYIAVGSDGRTHQGLLAAEAGGSVELLAADGKRSKLLKSEIVTLKNSGVSLMPAGFEKDLTPQDLADLIAFLRESRPERKTFAGNEPRTVEPEGLRGEFWLLAPQAEIYGPTLTFRTERKDLVDWKSDADAAAWTIDVKRTGTYRLSVEYGRAATTGGAVATVEIDGEPRTIELTGTGGDERYVERAVADAHLEAGQRRVLLRATSTGDENTWRPQAVRLRPID